MDQITAEHGTCRLLAELKDYLARRRPDLVPWGFELEAVRSVSQPNIFAPDLDALARNQTTIELRLPVIWEPEGFPVRASATPTLDNLNELRQLIELGLRSGEYWELRAARVDSWEPVLPEHAPKPSKIDWSLTVTIHSH